MYALYWRRYATVVIAITEKSIRPTRTYGLINIVKQYLKCFPLKLNLLEKESLKCLHDFDIILFIFNCYEKA